MLPPKKIKKTPENKVIVSTGSTSPSGPIIAPTSATIQYTPKNALSRAARAKSGFIGSETEGIKVDQSGHSTAKPFTRTTIVSPGGYTRVYGDDKKLLKEGPGHTKEMQDYLKASNKKVDETNSARKKNETWNNLVGGTATNITQKHINALNQEGQASGNPIPKEVTAAAQKEQSIKNLTEKLVAEKIASDKAKKVRLPKK
jgi:hypothetical protein